METQSLIEIEPEPLTTSILTSESVTRELDNCLSNIKGGGSFALAGILTDSPDPNIKLSNGGKIGLPLSDRDAQLIVDQAHLAPFGKGELTIVDTNVRKTWELSPTEFQLTNPEWDSYVQNTAVQMSAHLGVSLEYGVSAQLYKMLLYDEGAHFRPHQDSEKAPQMSATMAISLPSKHEGGEVRVMHAGETRILETAPTSDTATSCLTWFADVTHEIKPVTSGRRLVLTYNLVYTMVGAPKPEITSPETVTWLRAILSGWLEKYQQDGSDISCVKAWLFEHQYTEPSLSYRALKGHDRTIAAHLRAVAGELGFCLYIANLNLQVHGGCDEGEYYDPFEEIDRYGDGEGFEDEDNFDYTEDNKDKEIHPIVDEIDRDVWLSRVVDLDGQEIMTNMVFDEEDFIQEEGLRDAEPMMKRNEGVSATHFYYRSVAVLLPKAHKVKFLLNQPAPGDTRSRYFREVHPKGPPKALKLIDRLYAKDIEGAEEDLKALCQHVVSDMLHWKQMSITMRRSWSYVERDPPHSDEVLTRIMTLSADLDAENVFLTAYLLWAERFTCSTTHEVGSKTPFDSPETFQVVGAAFVKYDLGPWLSLHLSGQISKLSKLSDRLLAINALNKGFTKNTGQTPSTIFQEWAELEIEKALTSHFVAASMKSADDGDALGALVEHKAPEFVLNTILPIVKANIKHAEMVIAFLNRVYLLIEGFNVDNEFAQPDIDEVFACLVNNFDLSGVFDLVKAQEADRQKALNNSSRFSRAQPKAIPVHPTSRDLARLLCNSFNQDGEPVRHYFVLIGGITGWAIRAPAELYAAFFMSFLLSLVQELEQRGLNQQRRLFTKFFQTIISCFINRYVGQRPITPTTWTQRTSMCTCGDCVSLNRFLVDPTAKVGRFAVAQKRRQHLHQQLDVQGGCTHETERRGSPQTLVVTKHRGQHQAAVKAWSQRKEYAVANLKLFPEGALKELLGDEYDSLMAVTPQAVQPLAPIVSSSYRNESRTLQDTTRRKVSNQGNPIVIEDV